VRSTNAVMIVCAVIVALIPNPSFSTEVAVRVLR
jgi:hypothetical protein